MTLTKILGILSVSLLLMNCTGKKETDKSMKKVENHKPPIIIAHRGGAKLAPENTLASFKNAIALGVDMIEIDVHLSRDLEIIVIHDESMDRTTNGTGEIRDLTLDEIKKYDAGSWFSEDFKNQKVPTLDETLKAINGQCKLLIEIKDGDERYPGLEERIVQTIKKRNATQWVVVQSFNKNSILRIKEMYPELITYYLLGKNFNQFYSEISDEISKGNSIEREFNGIAPHYSSLDKNKVALLHNAGYGVYTFTVNDKSDMQKVIEIGVDGIITDSPDILGRIMNQ
jgi:glycerophosphoryl diester phosphodiesterase